MMQCLTVRRFGAKKPSKYMYDVFELFANFIYNYEQMKSLCKTYRKLSKANFTKKI